MTVEQFVDQVDGFGGLSMSAKIQLLVYFLTVVRGAEFATRAEIETCFNQIDEYVPSSLATQLSTGLRSRPKKYVRTKGGYRLERNCRARIEQGHNLAFKLNEHAAASLQPEPPNPPYAIQHLQGLRDNIPGAENQKFLDEVISCYGASAYRAVVITGWVLAVDFLFERIVNQHISEINALLSADGDKRLSSLVVTSKDELSLIKESKLLEMCVKMKIFTKDSKKVWDEKLALRNSIAHPSAIHVGPHKAAAFIEDLVSNMILKLR